MGKQKKLFNFSRISLKTNKIYFGGYGMSKVDLSWKRYIMPPIHPEGWRFVAIAAAATLLLWVISAPLGTIGTVLTIYCYFFFRDPVRVTPAGENFVISPADGIVSSIREVVPPEEMELGDKPMTRICVFMSVFNVHVNRAPVSGTVIKKHYRPGAFVNVSLDKESENNERMEMVVETDKGVKIGVIQVAGLVARRILNFTQEGQRLTTGQRFGLIRFGSRLDIYLPTDVAPAVVEGQIAVAGETILADLSVKGVARTGEMQ